MDKKKLYKIRKELGWSQQRMASEINCTKGNICHMEKGRVNIGNTFIEALNEVILRHIKKVEDLIK